MSAADPAYAFQVALAAALLAASPVTDLVGPGVYEAGDAEGVPYPFVEIGEDQVLSDDNTAGSASEIVSTLHVWADGPGGRLTAKQICGALRDVLTNPNALNIDGHQVVSAIAQDAKHFWEGEPTAPGGRVAHSVAVFHFQTHPVA